MKRLFIGTLLAVAVQAAQAAEPRTVDLLVLYTQDAQALPNGRDMDARIASYIEYANNAYKKSNVDLRLRLVHRQLLDWASYPTISDKDLAAFAADSRVQQLRETYGADMVHLIGRTQEGQGYGVCGIGYVLSGPKNSGTFQAGSANSAYAITGVDCGLSTMAHEIGHNMGLRHSFEQDQTEGYYQSSWHQGTFEWSRGYGVQGQFSTIMGYPQVFNARVQAPLFSSPRVVDSTCANQPCGQENHADAARALNAMAAQIAALRATKVPETQNPTNPGTPTPPPTTPPTTPTPAWCNKPALSGLVANGEFRTEEGWQALLGNATTSLVNVGKTCRDNALLFELASGDSDILATPVSALREGARYRLRAKVMLKGTNARGNLYLGILHEANDRISYSSASGVTQSVTSSEFTTLERTFTYTRAQTPPRTTYVGLISRDGLSVLVDEVELSEVAEPKPTPPAPSPLAWNFENGAAGWAGFHGTTRLVALGGNTGTSLESYARLYEGSGASIPLLGKVQSGFGYRLAADVMIGRNAAIKGLAYGYLYLEDGNGQGRYLPLGMSSTVGGAWSRLQQDVQIPAGTYRRVELLILGTRKDQSLYLDNVSFNRL